MWAVPSAQRSGNCVMRFRPIPPDRCGGVGKGTALSLKRSGMSIPGFKNVPVGAQRVKRAQLERRSKNGCMVFRDLGTSCSVHIFAEASVQLRMGCGLRKLMRRLDSSLKDLKS
ncbi:hypothetical protein GRJ2_001787800 [Grus japonensis]|uniref:Uncharacterized protein n=1 Tax=Grus japonensis TaxID=30415 RepID=A0ABC9X6B2_GRUJA